MRSLLLAAAGAAALLFTAPAAAAAPQCTDVGPRTTQCSTAGSTQIVTTPPVINYGPPWWYGSDGYGYGGFLIDF